MDLLLYRVDYEAATSERRPNLWQAESGWLTFYLFADDPTDAAYRAKAIAEELPYIITNKDATVHDLDGPKEFGIVSGDDDDASDDLDATKAQMEANARVTGLAFAFVPIVREQPPKIGASKMIRMVLREPAAPGPNDGA